MLKTDRKRPKTGERRPYSFPFYPQIPLSQPLLSRAAGKSGTHILTAIRPPASSMTGKKESRLQSSRDGHEKNRAEKSALSIITISLKPG